VGDRVNAGGLMRCLRLAALAAIAGGLAACGSSGNGVASKTGPQILQAAAAALKSSKSFYASGSGTSGSQTLTLALHIFSNGDFNGTITDSGQKLNVVVVSPSAYIEATVAYWESNNVPASFAKTLENKYVKVPLAKMGFDSLTYSTLAKQIVDPGPGKVVTGSTSTFAGQSVVAVNYIGTGKNKGQSGTLYVATSGKAYPVQFRNFGGSGGTVTISDWNAASPPVPPTNVVNSPTG
jgi:hypothetical protein